MNQEGHELEVDCSARIDISSIGAKENRRLPIKASAGSV
jgi:hypothetical protein